MLPVPPTEQLSLTFKYVPSVQLVILQSGVWISVYCQNIFQSLFLSSVVTSSVYSLSTVMAAEMALADSKGHIGPDQLVEQQKQSLRDHPHTAWTCLRRLLGILTCSSHRQVLARAIRIEARGAVRRVDWRVCHLHDAERFLGQRA